MMFDPATGRFSVPPGPTARVETRYRGTISDLSEKIECALFESATFPEDMSGRLFVRCLFRNTTFAKANLTDVKFDRCQLSNSSFQGAELHDVEYFACDFAALDKGRNSWRQAQLRNVLFNECNFISSDFSGSDLATVTFQRCRLVEVSFDGAHFVRRASQNVDYTTFSITDSFCHKIDFSRALLGASAFSGSSMSMCSFRNANLSGANFAASYLADVDLREAILEDVDFRRTTFEKTDLIDARSWYRAKVNVDDGAAMLKTLGFIVRRQ